MTVVDQLLNVLAAWRRHVNVITCFAIWGMNYPTDIIPLSVVCHTQAGDYRKSSTRL